MTAIRGGALLVVIALLVAGGLLLAPDWSREVWSAGALAASVVGIAEAFFSLGPRRERVSTYEAALQTPATRIDRPADLEKLERTLGWRSYSSAEYDNRVRPILCRAAASRVGKGEAPPALAQMMSDVPTEGSVRTSDIDRTVTQIERL